MDVLVGAPLPEMHCSGSRTNFAQHILELRDFYLEQPAFTGFHESNMNAKAGLLQVSWLPVGSGPDPADLIWVKSGPGSGV
jgi:hypothetical protein